jgi:hypothetical protein
MPSPAISQRLQAAQRRMEAAIKALAPKHKGGEHEEFEAAKEALLAIEREAMEADQREHAAPLDFPVRWDTGAPLPFVLSSEQRTFLTFYVRVPDAGWDGTYVNVKDPGDASSETLALVEFQHCHSVRFGGPNDEVLHGHPLYGKGLEEYTAQVVRHSSWLRSLEAINAIHTQYRPDSWRELNHYVLWFHDSTFECIARSFTVEVFQEPMAVLLDRVSRRLLFQEGNAWSVSASESNEL